jgi:hypothetical protein
VWWVQLIPDKVKPKPLVNTVINLVLHKARKFLNQLSKYWFLREAPHHVINMEHIYIIYFEMLIVMQLVKKFNILWNPKAWTDIASFIQSTLHNLFI